MSDLPSRLQAWTAVRRVARIKLAIMKTIGGRARRGRRAEARMIAASSLFDREWYLRTYPDVGEAGLDPLDHYMAWGWREGRDPGPEFATSAYLAANADVRRSGVNPLLHYIEFGHAEGRGTFGHRPILESLEPISFEFGLAAPCSSFAVPEAAPPAWRRAYRLDDSNPASVRIGDIAIGYSPGAASHEEFGAAAELLGLLSGSVQLAPGKKVPELPKSSHRAVDAWYVNHTQLRTRWIGEKPQFVVRALQCDPSSSDAISLIADGLVCSPLDIIDVHLTNAFYPILFIFSELDGTLCGCRLLAFPSLCRGGAHYAELVSLAESGISGTIDLLEQSDHLAGRLLRLIMGDAVAAIADITVDLTGADGSTFLFQPDFRSWLQNVLSVSIAPIPDTDASSDGFLASATHLEARDSLRAQGGSLVIAHDMVPTIGALTERQSHGSKISEQILLPVLVAGAEAAQPATLIELPEDTADLLGQRSFHGWGAWPRLMAAAVRTFPPGAIRVHKHNGVSDAELILPVADGGFASPSQQRGQITWFIEATGWEGELSLAIQCVALQRGGNSDRIALIGPVKPATLLAAEKLFDGRVSSFADMKAAARSVDTPLAAFIGAGVLLHDHRFAELMSTLLDNELVSTASCVLVRVERAGRGWQAAIVDAGSLAGQTERGLDGSGTSALARQLWRSNFPVASPPRDLWMTRSTNLATWINDGAAIGAGGGLHLCSFLLTASHVGNPLVTSQESFVPRLSEEHATKLEAIYG